MELLKLHKLTPESQPIDWVNTMFTKHRGKRNCKKQTLFHDWALWSIVKGFLTNYGQDDHPYLLWELFTVREINCFV